ncbi:Calx-beta domain-containing protein [Maribacter sp. LLG6340-A2]|uniref:Calx-beta domain-containing protein n=1 Tax=Maribacter sp. LLG6340-A2 TaxID=3160834 RepID=UPI003866B051
MKSKIVFLLYFLAVNIGIAQVTLIPDSNFEQALIDQNYDDVLDGSVLTSNIQNITFLNLTNDDNFNINENEIGLGITDLTGIKDFTSLVELWVQGNDLTSLDLEGLTTIEDIRAFYNDIENLNINGLTNLEIAGLDFNNIASLDLSSNTSLRIFDIANNNLLSLDIRGLSALTNMNIQNNPQLNCIQVEDTARATSLNNNTNFRRNGSTVFSANCPSIYTLIPDVNFEQSLLDQGIDTEGGIPNGRVLTSDISSITILDISNEGINDLTGIEDFISIQDLNISFNDLNALPLQNNTLQIIRANECNLSGKPISFINGGTILPNVTTLELQNNTIGNSGTISFTGVPNVSYLDVRYNNFNSIVNLSQLTQLTNLNVAFCNLSTIDVSQNSLLDTLYIFGNNLTSLNTNSNSSLSLLLAGGNNINTVALNNNTLLTTLDLSDNNLGSITLPETTTLEELNLFSNNLSSLDISGVDSNLITFNAIENLALTCIQVSDVNNANNQAGWQKDSGTSYSVDCTASTAFGVLANLTNAGNTPNYEITEGETFTLNFDADNNATNGTQYNPIIDFSINGNSNVTDFRFNGNETTIPNSPFTVSAINPDGSISVTAFDDGIDEGDEVYTITVTSSDTNLFTILEPSIFTLTVKDKGQNQVNTLIAVKLFENSVSDSKDALQAPYTLIEGGSNINFGFDVLNKETTELSNYNINITTFDDSAIATNNDYNTINENLTITTNDTGFDFYSSYLANLTALNDDSLDELDETFFVEISPPDNTFSLVDYSTNPEGEVLNPGEKLIIEIVIKNSKIYSGYELIIFETEINGDFEIENNEYTVNEGETLLINFNARTPNNAENYEIPIIFSISEDGAVLNQDYELNFGSSITTTINNSENPDGILEIKINTDNFNEPGQETITLFFPGDEFGNGPYVFDNYDPNSFDYSGLTITIKINDVSLNNSILAELENTGGTEGNGIQAGRDGEEVDGEGFDTFTLTLKKNDGSEYNTTQELTFPITFSPDLSLPENLRAEIINYNQSGQIPAENDIKLIAPSEIINTPPRPNESITSQIVIPIGASSGSITLALPQENEFDDAHEYYLATVQEPNEEIQISLPNPLQAKIIDDEGKFIVHYTLDDSNMSVADGPGAGCCAHNTIEEGDAIKFSFNAEKGAKLNEEYKIEIVYSDGTNPINLSAAEEGLENDYYTTAAHEDIINSNGLEAEIITATVGEQNPDYDLVIQTNPDDDEVSERFGIELKSYSDNFNLQATRQYYRDYVILPTVEASLTIEDATADEEDYINNKGLFKIKIDDLNGASTNIEIAYLIEGTAENGNDYITIEGSVLFSVGDLEKTIEIEAIPDDIPEDEKTIILTLLDGQGYTVDKNNNRGTVVIPRNDQDKIQFKVDINPLNDQIFENPLQNNTGTFEISIDPPNTSGIDLNVNYSFIDDNELYPAIEGDNNDFTQNGTGVLTFKSGESNIQTITVVALEDPDSGIEEPETITMLISEGERYQAGAKAKMEIVSTEFDTSSLNSTALQVSVATNTCADTNEGDVTIKNNSGFDFIASINSLGMKLEIERNKEATFTNLPSGRHLVTFKFIDENIDIIPPSYEVFIKELNGLNLSGKQVNLTSKMVDLKVSGSRRYSIFNGFKEHVFEFKDFKEKTISIPIINGINDITITGEAACQGLVKTQVVLNEIYAFPNPTDSFLTFSGFVLEEQAQVIITDFSGKNFLNTILNIVDGSIEVNLSTYPTGIYFGQIHTKSGQNIKFKLIKD